MLSAATSSNVGTAARSLLSHCGRVARQKRRSQPSGALGAVRYLNVHEYVAMEIFQQYGIKVPRCKVASSPEEAENAFIHGLNTPGQPLKDCVIKAQVLAGGRKRGYFPSTGLQSGVHVISEPGQARDLASQMLGQTLVTPQTPPNKGIPCHKVLVMERMYVHRELYVSILMDRASQGPLLIVSPRGGGPMGEVARLHPDLIYTEQIDIVDGLDDDQCERAAYFLELECGSEGFRQCVQLLKNLYDMFSRCDATQVEINPLAETTDGDIVACDAKVHFDDNAAFRQASIFEKRDKTQEDPREVEAGEYDLNYVGMDGTIGCMVNGAGFAMATMDLIKLKGGQPANFLEVVGGASEEQVVKALDILNSDPSVKAILVNIFGGIMRCDVIANGIINAAEDIKIHKPMVVCLQGTNVDEARTLIEACSYKMILADNLDDAAEKVVGVAKIREQADKINLDVKFDGLNL